MTVEVVALFHAETDFRRAVAALTTEGFAADRISLLASCDTVESKLGGRFRRTADLADRADAPRLAFVPEGEATEYQHTMIGALSYVAAAFGLILASSGGLATMILAATAAGGTVATVGETLKWLVGQDHAAIHQEQLECGGLLLWVRVETPEEHAKAMAVLVREGGVDAHAHSVDPTALKKRE